MTDPTRGTTVRQALELLQELTVRPPLLDVPWPDFPLWLAHLRADGFTCSRRHDGRVNVSLCEPVGEWGCVIVTAVVDRVRDVELPAAVPGRIAKSVRLPAVELERCERFNQAVAAVRT